MKLSQLHEFKADRARFFSKSYSAQPGPHPIKGNSGSTDIDYNATPSRILPRQEKLQPKKKPHRRIGVGSRKPPSATRTT